MFTRVFHFLKAWEYEREGTLKLLKALTDASLGQAVAPEDRTLGRIAWHLTTAIAKMMNRTGLAVVGPVPEAPVPATAAAIVASYDQASASLLEQVKTRWNDDTLAVQDEMSGEKWKRGFTLASLINHQTHHRGQMTVLMRQAGLKVPGVYGPAREEWAAFGMAAPSV